MASTDKTRQAKVSLEEIANTHRESPYSMDFEQALLACCILEGGQESLAQCIEGKISGVSFYHPSNKAIYEALLELYETGSPCNEITLGENLKGKNQLDIIGGYAYINEVTDRIDTPAHMFHYLKKVRELELLRRIITFSMKTLEDAFSSIENTDQLLEKIESEVFSISEDRFSESIKHVKSSVDNAIHVVQNMFNNKGALTGISSGFKDLDNLTFGFHNSEMIVVAARPAMGKTSLALNFAESSAFKNQHEDSIPTLIFSLEMSSEQLAMRLLCSKAKVKMDKLRDGFLSSNAAKDLYNAASEIKQAPIWVDESANMNILELRAKARRMDSRQKLGLVIIDYLQLLGGTDNKVPREQQISEISRGIKAMAKELKVPVIVLSQLNRESEKEKRQPRLSDLRESGAIEQDADLVLLLSKKKDFDEEEEYAPIVIRELIVAKQRNGPVGVVPLTFIKNLTKFESYATTHETE